jgi:hypothetical protein
LKVLHEKFGEDVVIISISVDPSYDTVQKLQQFRQEYGTDWTVALDAVGVCKNYWHVIPTLVLVDQTGYIRYTDTGVVGADALSKEIYATAYNFDLNCDGKVNIVDVSLVAKAFATRPGDEKWNEAADLDHNKVINIVDVTRVANKFGFTFNFILNPSVEIEKFDHITKHYDLPANWQPDTYDDVGANHTWLETGHTGNRSLKVSVSYNASASLGHSANWYQPVWITSSLITNGSKYLTSFWYQSNIKFYSYVSFWDSQYKWIADQKIEHEPANIWTKSRRLEFTVPEGTYYMTAGILVYNGDAAKEIDSYAVVDDFEFIRG